jgi:hypothetical protein
LVVGDGGVKRMHSYGTAGNLKRRSSDVCVMYQR